MLNAIIKNKLGSNMVEDDINWRDIFKTTEDSLTASVIGNLLYLPDELFWQIIKNACYSNELPQNTGRLYKYEFWPRWNLNLDKNNNNYVEPDVFLRYDDIDIIIESKRYDEKLQYREQWKREIKAYKEYYGNDNNKVFLIAIGGIRNTNVDIMFNKYKVIKLKWTNLLYEITKITKAINKSEYRTNSETTIKRILDDIIKYFEMHDFYSFTWIEDTKFHRRTYKKSYNMLLNDIVGVKNE
jgi:hypothetical protein